MDIAALKVHESMNHLLNEANETAIVWESVSVLRLGPDFVIRTAEASPLGQPTGWVVNGGLYTVILKSFAINRNIY